MSSPTKAEAHSALTVLWQHAYFGPAAADRIEAQEATDLLNDFIEERDE